MNRNSKSYSARKKSWVRTATWNIIGDVEAQRPMTTRNIAMIVARGFGVKVSDMQSRSMWWIDVAARQIAMALAYRFSDEHIHSIAEFFARDRNRVVGACDKYNDLIDETLRESGLRIPPRHRNQPGAPRKIRLAENDMLLLTLASLESWSIDGSYTHVEDFLPSVNVIAASKRMAALKQLGYAEDQHEDNATFWRITELGRNAFPRVKVAA
jgi:Bacterial dnaA protein helix-turn-helix